MAGVGDPTLHDLPPPEVPTLDEIRDAASRIGDDVLRTPLVRLDGTTDPEIWLKLENLQSTNSFKIRGALSAITALPEDERSKGVWTASTGNAGQGVAYAARQAGVPATVVAVDTAPQTKLDRMRALGAEVVTVPFEDWWSTIENRDSPGMEGTFIHPCDDHQFIAGNASIGLEIMSDLPETRTVIAPVGGGGLSTGVGSAVKALVEDPDSVPDRADSRPIQVFGAEPETAAPLSLSYERGKPVEYPQFEESWIGGAGGKSALPRMWERLQQVVDDVAPVPLDDVEDALRVLAERTRVIAEGAGALPVAAALGGAVETDGPVVAVVSGGNIDLDTFREITRSAEARAGQ